jgi:hypothetical protein
MPDQPALFPEQPRFRTTRAPLGLGLLRLCTHAALDGILVPSYGRFHTRRHDSLLAQRSPVVSAPKSSIPSLRRSVRLAARLCGVRIDGM